MDEIGSSSLPEGFRYPHGGDGWILLRFVKQPRGFVRMDMNEDCSFVTDEKRPSVSRAHASAFGGNMRADWLVSLLGYMTTARRSICRISSCG
ncbi:hypothetical protein R1flu_019296 [Riccia fluitans]|uniref:Uncharacterized protein n=1 Tax=Riccia fluitans TaxID=41844 RepID=A0ABD1ZIF6_9MARC